MNPLDPPRWVVEHYRGISEAAGISYCRCESGELADTGNPHQPPALTGRSGNSPDDGLASIACGLSDSASQLVMSAILLGIGLGALGAMCAYVSDRVRPSDPVWANQAESPLIQHQIGRYSAMLAAARSALLEAARSIADFLGYGGSRADVPIKMMQAKVTIIDAALMIAGDVHRHCGETSTSNALRFVL